LILGTVTPQNAQIAKAGAVIREEDDPPQALSLVLPWLALSSVDFPESHINYIPIEKRESRK